MLTSLNLTAEDNLDRFYITLRQVDDVLSFFSLFQGNFSLFQKNIQNNSSSTTENFISITGERSVIWGANTETQILVGYYSPPGSGEFGVRVLDIGTGDFVDTPLASNVFDTLEPLYFNQRLFASYLDNNDRYHLVVFSTADFLIIRSFDFGDQIPAFLIDETGNLVLLRGRQGVFSKEVYSLENMDLLMSDPFQLNEFLEPGPLNAYLTGNKLYYQSALVQPAPLSYTPAVYNFDNTENRVIDILTIRETVIEQIGQNFIPTSFGFDEKGRNFLMGFAKTIPNGTFNGGIIIIAEDGTLIETLELPVAPTYFIKN
ncbi:MAG: hypothetical protein WBN59_11025 [Flavobacteriaceae bacterium]